jgi:hypothetical protein
LGRIYGEPGIDPKYIEAMLQREFNEKENERRAERERWEEKQKEEQHKAFLRSQEEMKKKREEQAQKLLKERLEERIAAFNDGNGGYCPRCNYYVQYVKCPNLRCNSPIVFGPLLPWVGLVVP